VGRWSVDLEAETARMMTHEEIVALGEALTAAGGVAMGIGTTHYGARWVVEAATMAEAVRRATAEFTAAVGRADVPAAPITRTGTTAID
jgi:hypothetical protein